MAVAEEAYHLADGTGKSVMPCPSAWDILAYPSISPEHALRIGSGHVRHNLRFQPNNPRRTWSSVKRRDGKKLTIGYMSSDLGPHAVGAVVRSIFGYHRKSGLRVVAFALGPEERNEWCTLYLTLTLTLIGGEE